MNIKELKDKFLKNRLIQGILIGAVSVLIIELLIFIPVRLCYRPDTASEVVQDVVNEEVAEAEKEAEVKEKTPVEKKEKTKVENEVGKCVPNDNIQDFNVNERLYDRVEGKVKNGDYFSTIMSGLGVDQNTVYELTQKSKGVFDMGQIKVGYPYHAYYVKGKPEKLTHWVYEKDSESYVLFTLQDSLSVHVYKKCFDISRKYTEVTISTSLWDAIIESEAPAVLAINLADIYAWTIDFFGLQKGDSFKALYDVRTFRGEIVGIDKITYAEFVHDDQAYKSYYFDDGSGNFYWNEKGESMRKAFLKAPLSYTRISSGFSYARRHPVTRKVRPHTGVDYAAPIGTEVMTVGDGVVVYKGRKTAEGNMVKIKHNSVYTTAYLHLSRFAKNLQVGQRVRQGQVIGYVGSTGYSTGPHLDYRIWKNGTPVNPLKMVSPPANPIAEKDKRDFEKSVIMSERKAHRHYFYTVINELNRLIE